MYPATIEIMHSSVSVFLLMRLPDVSTSLSSRQQKSKPIGFPKVPLYHMMDRAHNHPSIPFSASMQYFPVPQKQLWCCTKHITLMPIFGEEIT